VLCVRYDEQKLTEVFRTIFNIPDLALRDDLTAADVPGWDSFNHVNLVIAIEMEFGVTFTTDEISALQNVGDMKRLLQQKLQ
jgi:acyl carrier protein